MYKMGIEELEKVNLSFELCFVEQIMHLQINKVCKVIRIIFYRASFLVLSTGRAERHTRLSNCSIR
jgi:hypothetical protein